jgi:hypothetical protein
MSGEPTTVILDESGQVNANATFYRFYPGIEFLDGIRHSTEHGSRNAVAGDYRGVAFYYADAAGTALVETDRVAPADSQSRTDHAYVADGERAALALSSSFEGRDDTTTVVATTLDHTGKASFDAKMTPENTGCFLRRTYDQANGRQRALVSVDGVEAGIWYAAESNATHRWAERDYLLPGTLTSGKGTARISIEPGPRSPAWSVSEYAVLCIIPGK